MERPSTHKRRGWRMRWSRSRVPHASDGDAQDDAHVDAQCQASVCSASSVKDSVAGTPCKTGSVQLQAATGESFAVEECNLIMASPFFESVLKLSDATEEGAQRIELNEAAKDVELIVQAIRPAPRSSPLSAAAATTLAILADKYQLNRVLEDLQGNLSVFALKSSDAFFKTGPLLQSPNLLINALEWMAFAERCRMQELMHVCGTFVSKHIGDYHHGMHRMDSDTAASFHVAIDALKTSEALQAILAEHIRWPFDVQKIKNVDTLKDLLTSQVSEAASDP